MIENTKDLQLQAFGENVRRLREESGLSRTALAKKLHISPKALQNLENGIVGPRMGVDVIFRLMQIFHVPSAELFILH